MSLLLLFRPRDQFSFAVPGAGWVKTAKYSVATPEESKPAEDHPVKQTPKGRAFVSQHALIQELTSRIRDKQESRNKISSLLSKYRRRKKYLDQMAALDADLEGLLQRYLYLVSMQNVLLEEWQLAEDETLILMLMN